MGRKLCECGCGKPHNPEAVREMRRRAAEGEQVDALKERFRVSGVTVRAVLSGKRWADVK